MAAFNDWVRGSFLEPPENRRVATVALNILYGAAVKLFVYGALVSRILVPFAFHDAFADWGLFIASMIFLAIGIGVVESVMARLRLTRVPQLLVTACLLSAFGMILVVR